MCSGYNRRTYPRSCFHFVDCFTPFRGSAQISRHSAPTLARSVSERMSTAVCHAWAGSSTRRPVASCAARQYDACAFSQTAAACTHGCTLPIELLPGESTSNVYRVSRYDSLQRLRPHVLLRLSVFTRVPGSPSEPQILFPLLLWVCCTLS